MATSLYNCGMSDGVRVVVAELASTDRLNSISIIGYSMGGNLVLKMAGEVKTHLSIVRNVYAICANIDPAQCVLALERPGNRLYHDYFFTRLRARIRRKAAILPGKWDLATLQSIKTILRSITITRAQTEATRAHHTIMTSPVLITPCRYSNSDCYYHGARRPLYPFVDVQHSQH